jgi:CRISPR/Cas system-associated exonuclease Cas4 (RecB family)
MKNEEKVKMKIEHISISREGTWSECAKKYYYRYHLGKLPPVEPVYFLYGKIVHKIIETYTLGAGKRDINEIVKSVLGGDIELEEGKDGKPGKKAGPLPIDYRAKLPEHLRSFMKLTKSIGFEGKVEWKFEHDLDPPNNRKLVGVIDRLLLTKDQCFIIDYKTTKRGPWRKTKATIGNDLQLQCYARIAQKNFGYKAEQIRCALFFLEGCETVDAQFSQETIDGVESRLLNVYKLIEATDAETAPGTVGKHCFRCDYKNICPYYNRI